MRIRPLQILAVLTACSQLACGEGTLVFGIPTGDDSITVTGTVNNVVPVNATRSIVVFVFTDLADPQTFMDFTDAESVTVSAGSSNFSIAGVSRGHLTVVFLLDDTDPDGVIDPGDFYAVLEDPDRRLVNVGGGRTVELAGIDINFESDIDGGSATVDSIRITSSG